MSNDAQILKDTKIWDVHKMESLGHEILHILWTATVEFFLFDIRMFLNQIPYHKIFIPDSYCLTAIVWNW